MGICSSCEATNVATAKLILLDGRLQEFSYPVKSSYVLAGDQSCFICNSDQMEVDDVVPSVDELLLGGLYFALPISKMEQRIQAEEMAALAVKASSALMKRCGGDRQHRCCKKVVDFPVVVRERDGDGGEVGRRRTVGAVGTGGGGGKGRRRRFVATLGSITE